MPSGNVPDSANVEIQAATPFGSRLFAGLAGCVFKYAADTGTKAAIEANMTFPGPLCKRITRASVLLFIHGWYSDANETWQQFPLGSRVTILACHVPMLSRLVTRRT